MGMLVRIPVVGVVVLDVLPLVPARTMLERLSDFSKLNCGPDNLITLQAKIDNENYQQKNFY